jgi:adenylate kinase family enzyme
MSSFKSRRFDSSAKSSLRSVAETRVKFKTSSQTNASQAAVFDQNQDDASNEEVRHRISYTREQKLAVINYATITVKTHKDESTRSINKYVTAKDLDIILVMLRN